MSKQTPKPAANEPGPSVMKQFGYGVAALKPGDRVKIRHHAGLRGRVVEVRGPLGPDGAQIYRVLLRRKPSREFVEVREDQLIAVGTDS